MNGVLRKQNQKPQRFGTLVTCAVPSVRKVGNRTDYTDTVILIREVTFFPNGNELFGLNQWKTLLDLNWTHPLYWTVAPPLHSSGPLSKLVLPEALTGARFGTHQISRLSLLPWILRLDHWVLQRTSNSLGWRVQVVPWKTTLGGEEDLNACKSPSSGPSNDPYAARMHVCARSGELLGVIYNLSNVSQWNPCEQQLQDTYF